MFNKSCCTLSDMIWWIISENNEFTPDSLTFEVQHCKTFHVICDIICQLDGYNSKALRWLSKAFRKFHTFAHLQVK